MTVKVSVSEATGQLTELVRLAEAGEDVVLTRHGHDVIRLAPVRGSVSQDRRRQVLGEIIASAAAKAHAGPCAARSQDVLYGEDGLPR